jgi:phosphate uptake regulator
MQAMRRKVIKLGENSLLVSLPSKWAKQHGITKGDEVEVAEAQGRVTITTSKSAKKDRMIALSDQPIIAARQVNSAYKKGIDELELSFENPQAYSAALEEMKNLIGFEVVESGKKHSKIKNIATGDMGDFSTVFRRVFLTLLEMSENAEECARTGSKDALEQVKLAEHNINRLTDFCKRLLNKQGIGDISATTHSYGLLKDIERAADHYRALSSSKSSRDARALLVETHAHLRQMYELYYSFDSAKAAKTIESLKALEFSAQKMLKSKNPAAAHHAASIISILKEMSWAVCSHSL